MWAGAGHDVRLPFILSLVGCLVAFDAVDVKAEFVPDAQQVGTWIAFADSAEQAVILEEWMMRAKQYDWGMQVRFIAERFDTFVIARSVAAMLTDLVSAINDHTGDSES